MRLTPSQDPKPIDHGSMGIGPNHTVKINKLFITEDYPSKKLQIDLGQGSQSQ